MLLIRRHTVGRDRLIFGNSLLLSGKISFDTASKHYFINSPSEIFFIFFTIKIETEQLFDTITFQYLIVALKLN